MLVTAEPATVYRANGRRYFSPYTAYMALAKQRIRAACDCTDGESESGRYYIPPELCRFHGDDTYPANYGERVLQRLYRWCRHLDKTGRRS